MGVTLVPEEERRVFVDFLTGALAPLTGRKVMLWTNDLDPSLNTVLNDLTEATFDGYVRSAVIDWHPAGSDAMGNAVAACMTTLYFGCTGPTVAEVVFGWALVDEPATKIILIERFDNPVSVQDVGDFVAFTPVFSFGQ